MTDLDVATTDVQSDDHVPGLVAQTVVVDVEVQLEQFFWVYASLFHAPSPLRVAEARQDRIVDLQLSFRSQSDMSLAKPVGYKVTDLRHPRAYRSRISSLYILDTSAK